MSCGALCGISFLIACCRCRCDVETRSRIEHDGRQIDHPGCGAKVGFAEIFLMPQPLLLTRRGLISNFQFPISNFQFPISNFQFPISNFQSQIAYLTLSNTATISS
jgi:hypothetical protein